jgi:hypothetical protein
VLLAGTGFDRRIWQTVADRMAADVAVTTVDAPGWARSDASAEPDHSLTTSTGLRDSSGIWSPAAAERSRPYVYTVILRGQACRGVRSCTGRP